MKKFTFHNLTEEVRQLMLNEVTEDIEAGRFFISPRLNTEGVERYPDLLIQSIKDGNEFSLQEALESTVYFNSTELREGKPVKVPSNAAQLLAQGEFNRYYIRAVCLYAQDQDGIVEVYRARESSWTRPESEAKVGQKLRAIDLLTDLRKSIGASPQLLPEVNSGLSVKV